MTWQVWHLWAALVSVFLSIVYYIWKWLDKYTFKDKPVNWEEDVPRQQFDQRRFETYPFMVANSWYHLADSKDIKKGQVYHYRALHQSFAVWRTSDGKPIVQEAFCPHMGANLAVGGTVKNDQIVCPFHSWSFDQSGECTGVPYLREGTSLPKCRPLKSFPALDWCGLLCVYFHAEGSPPEFELPQSIQQEVTKSYVPHMKWDLGHRKLTPTDWLDQAGDHCHFHTLHSKVFVPWTTKELPWLTAPVKLSHKLTTYMGDDEKFHEKHPTKEMCKQYIYFTDEAGPDILGHRVDSLCARTVETYIGPAMMVFHVPLFVFGFSFGAKKIFVSTTPVEGGSLMRVRTFTSSSLWPIKAFAWFIGGVSASHLMADVIIMENKVRLKKPYITRDCGPWNKTNTWLKQFYSESSADVGKMQFVHDW